MREARAGGPADPDPGAEAAPAGDLRVVTAAWTAGRTEPDQRAEMSTQWLCGEVLGVLEREPPWLRVRGPDGYVSWVHRGGLAADAASPVAGWEEAATALSLGLVLSPDLTGAPPPGTPRYLPWGARVAAAGARRVRLPGGEETRCRPEDALVEGGERARRFPPEGEAVVRTALRWRGAPYLWGGRTRQGADCSGFVQAVYAMHGVPLPRDAADQLAAGPEVPGAAAQDATAAGLDATGAGPAATDAAGTEAPARDGPDVRRRSGDLLFFGEDAGTVTHVAMVVGGTRVVHAAAGNGSVAVDDLAGAGRIARRLRRRLVGATRPLASG